MKALKQADETKIVHFTTWHDASLYKYLVENHYMEVDQIMTEAYDEIQKIVFLDGFFASAEEEEDERMDRFDELAAAELEAFCRNLVQGGFDTMSIGFPSLDDVYFGSVVCAICWDVERPQPSERSPGNPGEMPAPTRIGRAVRWNYEELRAWENAGGPPQSEWMWPQLGK